MKFNKKLFIPSLLAVLAYLLSYQLPKILISVNRYHYLSTPFDEKIPFVPIFMLIYIGAFLQWTNGILFLCKQETKKAYKYLSAIIIGSLIGMSIFLIYPTATSRPEIIGNSLIEKLCAFIFSIDSDVNAFPSFHCFCSLIVVIVFIDFKADKKAIIFNIIYSLLVFASTVLTKQHVFLDIPGGVALAIIANVISKYISFDSLFDKLNSKINI